MFEIFLQMLASDERIQFTVARKGKGLSVLIQPELKMGIEPNADDQINQLRGALAMPLYIETTAEELDANFPLGLAEYAQVRKGAYSEFCDAISRIKEGVKQARPQIEVTEKVLPETPVVEVVSPSNNPNSLFGAGDK